MNHKARDSKAGHKNWVPNITVFTGKLVTTQGVKITQAEGLFLNRGDEDVIKIKKNQLVKHAKQNLFKSLHLKQSRK